MGLGDICEYYSSLTQANKSYLYYTLDDIKIAESDRQDTLLLLNRYLPNSSNKLETQSVGSLIATFEVRIKYVSTRVLPDCIMGSRFFYKFDGCGQLYFMTLGRYSVLPLCNYIHNPS